VPKIIKGLKMEGDIYVTKFSTNYIVSIRGYNKRSICENDIFPFTV
jgi:hypothetical protein